ncbi:hypothetical protein DL96DRAFT_1576930 [Flagelloscypha sp. PMI_526]|nr:hypothetical protein DL96DRAFT_1576930 [Flagelloscypha sp. PMI_526]
MVEEPWPLLLLLLAGRVDFGRPKEGNLSLLESLQNKRSTYKSRPTTSAVISRSRLTGRAEAIIADAPRARGAIIEARIVKKVR